jgi:amphi-Trp domain-containing protein
MQGSGKRAQKGREGKFSHDSVQDASTLAAHLQALRDGFESGRLVFSRKDAEIVLSPSGLIGFSVEAKAKDGRMNLTLKFNWREASPGSAEDGAAMSISS